MFFCCVQGEAYFVRVYAYNMKGFGPAQMAMPHSAMPSSWHDVADSKPRYEGATYSMQLIAAQLSNLLSSVPPGEINHTYQPREIQRNSVLASSYLIPHRGCQLKEHSC